MNVPCLFSENNITVTCKNFCLFHWVINLSDKGSLLNGKEFAPRGANSFLLELTHTEHRGKIIELLPLLVHPFTLTLKVPITTAADDIHNSNMTLTFSPLSI